MEPKQTLDITSRLLSGVLFNQYTIHICLRKNKSKQSYVWIYSIFEAQNICFGSEIAGLLDHSYNKCALGGRKAREISKTCKNRGHPTLPKKNSL